MDTPNAAPPIVDREAFDQALAGQVALEKELTRHSDRVSAARRRLPMTPVGEYTFDVPDGPLSLTALFGGGDRLIVQHFMFHPDWDQGCPSCSYAMDDTPRHLVHLAAQGIEHAVISRAPIEAIEAYRARMGWTDITWVSSGRTTFNTDWGWSTDDGEIPGYSCYLLREGVPYLTYSTRARGVEVFVGSMGWVDATVYGRCEEWEDSPDGWPQHPTYGGELRRHDEY